MFVRTVGVRLKPNSLTEFANLMECEILPWLRKQEGFSGFDYASGPEKSQQSVFGTTKGMRKPTTQAVIQRY